MNTQNKIKVKALNLDLDLMYSGCSLKIWYTDPLAGGTWVEYRVTGNRRAMRVVRFSNSKWETIIPEDMTMNPLSITEEEKFMISILPGLSHFEKELYEVGGNVIRMWHNDADHGYVKSYVKEFLSENMEQII